MKLGASLGPYRIDRELGAGGMGEVYAATGPAGTVALKVVHPHLLETPGFFKRFMREAQLGQSIRHKNVVRTIDCDQEFADGKPRCFLVMEYVEGQTLADLLRELECVPEELCRHVAREICKGLTAIHDAGVVHRDLKPENVLITPEHVVKVMDLGIAQVADEALRLSRSGAFVGSVEYAAPEQFKGGEVDGRTDLHALGVLLYELSSGQHPYRGGGFHQVLTRVCNSAPRRLGEVNPQLSAFFEEVVHTLLVKDPRGRFTSATQLLDVLEQGEDAAWWHERARSLQAETRRPLRRIRIPRETAVHGREAELARLRELYGTADSGDGRVVLIEGEAGIGKSRLVDEFLVRLRNDGQDINFLFGSYPPGGAATADGAFSTAFREQFGEAGCAPYLGASPALAPAFDALLQGRAAPAGIEALTKGSAQACFVNATRALARERTTIVLIDDLHFAPDEGRALFSALAMAVPGHPVLLIGTSRPTVDDSWSADLTRLDHVDRLGLRRLGARELVKLLAEAFRSERLADSLGARIALKSDGNPFFAFEIFRGLREGQFIQRGDDGTWTSTRVIDEIAIPSSVLDLVNARVASLTEDERNLLDVAACVGFEFDPLLVGEVVGIARIPLLQRLGQIERQHRLVRSAGVRYLFDHHQVQEALYGSLSELLRREYHAALAEAMETHTGAAEKAPDALDGALCVNLCEHFLAGHRGERALRYLPAAQAHLESGYLSGQAVDVTERALAVPGLLRGPERARALIRLAHALNILARRDRQESAAREALRLAKEAGDAELQALAGSALGLVLDHEQHLEEAEAVLRDAIEIARSSGDLQLEASAGNILGGALQNAARFSESREVYERCVAISRRIGDVTSESQSVKSLGSLAKLEGDNERALELYQRALALAREGKWQVGEVVVLATTADTLRALGRSDAAREHAEHSLAVSRKIGYRLGEALAAAILGDVFLDMGRRDRARQCFEAAYEVRREIGDRKGEAEMADAQANVLHEEGRYDDAIAWHHKDLAISREIGDRQGEIGGLANLGYTLCDVARYGEAEAHLERALAISREIGDRTGERGAMLNLAVALRGQGRVEEARTHLDTHLTRSREDAVPRCEALGLHNLADLAYLSGNLQLSKELFEASGEILERLRFQRMLTRTRLMLGAVHASAGDVDRARDELVAARDTSREHGYASMETSARCRLALLPGGDPGDALAAYDEHGERLEAEDRTRVPFLLWRATGDPEHLRVAKRDLDRAMSHVAPEHHESMCTNVPLNREILAAWREEFGHEGDAPKGASPDESPTRAG